MAGYRWVDGAGQGAWVGSSLLSAPRVCPSSSITFSIYYYPFSSTSAAVQTFVPSSGFFLCALNPVSHYSNFLSFGFRFYSPPSFVLSLFPCFFVCFFATFVYGISLLLPFFLRSPPPPPPPFFPSPPRPPLSHPPLPNSPLAKENKSDISTSLKRPQLVCLARPAPNPNPRPLREPIPRRPLKISMNSESL